MVMWCGQGSGFLAVYVLNNTDILYNFRFQKNKMGKKLEALLRQSHMGVPGLPATERIWNHFFTEAQIWPKGVSVVWMGTYAN